jgi:hypothetical protein
MNDERLHALIQTHLTRYPQFEVMDTYKLLHQATFGPGHLIASKKATREWLESESEQLTPSMKELLVETIHPDGRIVRLHLRPYLAYGGKLKPLLDAFVRSAGQVPGDPDAMAHRWLVFERLCQPGGVYADRFDLQEVRMFGRIRRKENWPAMHHSPTYQTAYKPAYRVLTCEEAEALCGAIGVPFELG